MSETGLVEPGGWLAEHQRRVCDGASVMTTYQGLICDEFILPQSAADHADPSYIVSAATAWAEAMLHQVYFLPGEFAPEALNSLYVSDYVRLAGDGGHANYYALRGANEIAVGCVRAGLKSMLADPHLELFTFMMQLRRAPRPMARKLAVQKGYRDLASALRDLDKRFAAIEEKEPLVPRHKVWLKSLRKLKFVPDAEMSQQLMRIANLNPLWAARKQEYARVRAAEQQADPAFRAATALADMAGLKIADLQQAGFAKMRALWPEGPDRAAYYYRMQTDKGPRAAAFYSDGGLFKKRLAVLIEEGNALPAGSLTLSRADYEAIVPHME